MEDQQRPVSYFRQPLWYRGRRHPSAGAVNLLRGPRHKSSPKIICYGFKQHLYSQRVNARPRTAVCEYI